MEDIHINGEIQCNKGGIISLLDENNIKIDGVSYTRADAKKKGWFLVF